MLLYWASVNPLTDQVTAVEVQMQNVKTLLAQTHALRAPAAQCMNKGLHDKMKAGLEEAVKQMSVKCVEAVYSPGII